MLREEVEMCPHCDTEITINWDVEKDGYQITCPNCAKRIYLCDACLNSEDNEAMHCDWHKGYCWRNPKFTEN